MLTPLFNSTLHTDTSSGKLTSVEKPPCPLDHDFFKPIATESGVSCTYSTEFYAAFGQGSSSTQQSELALLVLDYMTIQDKARLPLFKTASDRYVNNVLPSILQIIRSGDEDEETLSTKFHIMNCAIQLEYLQHPDIFRSNVWEHRVKLNKVSLIKMKLFGVNLFMSDLRGSDLRGSDLRVTDLMEADLSGADLTGANLSGANLSGADLTGTNLTGTELTGTELTGANLTGAKLAGAELTGAVFTKSDCLIS